MPLPIRFGVGLTVLSAIAVPGIWLIVSSEPRFTTISNSSGSGYTGNFGEDFGHHLVDAESEKNQSWWDWSFKYRWKVDSSDEKNEEFNQISSGIQLRDKCKEAYKNCHSHQK